MGARAGFSRQEREQAARGSHRPNGRGIVAAIGSLLPSGIAAAVGAETLELGGLVRRVAPTRRRAGILGAALLAVVAMGGIAGAAEPQADNRSALDAYGAGASSVPASAAPAIAPAGSAAPVVAVPSAAPAAGLPADALGTGAMFSGPDPLDLVTKGALVAVLLFITLRILRRVQGVSKPKPGSLLDVLETRTLGPKTQLHLVAVGDRRFVVGQSPAGLVALGELDAAELPVAEVAPLFAVSDDEALPAERSTGTRISRRRAAGEQIAPAPVTAAPGSITSLYTVSGLADPDADGPEPVGLLDRIERSPRSTAIPVMDADELDDLDDPRPSPRGLRSIERSSGRTSAVSGMAAPSTARPSTALSRVPDGLERADRAERKARVDDAMAAADRAASIAERAAAAAERAAAAAVMADRAVAGIPSAAASRAAASRRPAPAPSPRDARPAARPAQGGAPAPRAPRGEIEAQLVARLTEMRLEERADGLFDESSPRPAAPVAEARPSRGGSFSDRLAARINERLAASSRPAPQPAEAASRSAAATSDQLRLDRGERPDSVRRPSEPVPGAQAPAAGRTLRATSALVPAATAAAGRATGLDAFEDDDPDELPAARRRLVVSA